MKKKLFLALAISIMLVCFFAISISAAEPNYDGEKVTLDDGTVCPLWDTDGNPLIWYVTSSTTVDNVTTKTYAYVDATSSAVAYINSSNSTNQLDNVTITVDGTDYAKTTIAVANFPNAKITAVTGNGRTDRIGEDAIRLFKTFKSCSNLEYAYVNTATTSVGQESFTSCSNLKFVNLADLTELTSIGAQAFNACSKLFDGQELDLTNTKLKEVANLALRTVKFTSVKLPEATFTTLGSETFRECTKLETVTGTAKAFEAGKLTSIGGNAYRNCYKLSQLDGLIENGILTIPEGVTKVETFAFTECDAITYIDLPSTLNYIGQQGFSYMTNVKLIDFGKISGKLTLNNCGHFRDMDNLIAVSLPEGMTQVSNRAFASCDNLTAFYMPNSVEILSTNGDGQGTFCGSQKLYFVQESFTVSQCLVDGVVDTTKLVLPEKPEVYYMPTSLTSFTGAVSSSDKYAISSMFRYCYALNDVIVFPESFTSAAVTRAFQEIGTKDSPKTIVFTGDIEEFVITHYSQYITFVFANENDKDFNDLGVIRTTGNSKETGSSAYFCSTGMRYDLAVSGRVGSDMSYSEDDITKIATTIEAIHATGVAEDFKLHAPHLDAYNDATCTSPAGNFTYCFCGKEMSFVAVEGSEALGHLYDNLTDMYFVDGNYFADAMHVYFCSQCNENIERQEMGTKLFTNLGYSANEENSSMIYYEVLTSVENINAYKEFTGVELRYGLVVSATPDGTPLTIVDGALVTDANTIKMEMTGTQYNKITIKVTNLSENAQLHCNGYVVVDGVISYLNHKTVDSEATTVTHATILEIKAAEDTEE